jgi:Protein of unknown function (DUF3738)
LLKARLGLAVHRESKEFQVYELTVATESPSVCVEDQRYSSLRSLLKTTAPDIRSCLCNRLCFQGDHGELRSKADALVRAPGVCPLCEVEIRSTNDDGQTYTIPEVGILFEFSQGMFGVPGQPREPLFSATSVVIGNKAAHASFTVQGCQRIATVAAGHLTPAMAIPAI